MTTEDRKILVLAVSVFVGGIALGNAAVGGMADLDAGRYRKENNPMTKKDAAKAALVCGVFAYYLIDQYQKHGIQGLVE